MGWTSTGDPYANVGEAGLSFDSEEAAKAFAEKHGWEYSVCLYSSVGIKLFHRLTCLYYLLRSIGILYFIP